LREVGAEPAEGGAELALRDATIAGLQEQLHNLRDLGDRLAQAEQLRLAAEAERAELRREVERLVARIEKLEERTATLREKADERHRTAADRWHEIRRLRGERRDLEQSLARERQRLERLQAPVQTLLDEGAPRTRAARARLIDLMRPEPEQ
jgi:chromosome segregation ATPase